MPSFGQIAPYYDRLMHQVQYKMWAGYYRLLLAQIGHKPETLLDVCCGTGSVAELLAAEGFRVTGFDISEQMVAEARRKSEANGSAADYVVADAAELDLGRKFDAAYSFFDSLNYITEPERLRAAVKHVGEHLEPGGSFIFDVNTAYAFEQGMFDQQDLREGSPLKYRWRGSFDRKTRIISISMEFWVGDEAFTEHHVQRAYSDEELRDCLSDAGMEVARVYDSYTLDPPRERSDRLHYLAVLRSG